MVRKVFFAGLAALIMASSANAAVIFGLAIDPATTAGANSNSTRVGAGTWHLYAVDNTGASSSGLSSFDVSLSSSASMAINNRSPQTNYDADGQGTSAPAGFTLLRQALGNNTPLIQLTGAQATPPSANSGGNVSVDYFPISGFGQTTGTFAAKYPAPILGPTTGSAWGTYTEAKLTGPEGNAASQNGAFKWVFLGEGTYTGTAPVFGPVGATVYSNFTSTFASVPPTGGSSSVILTLVPEPATLSLIGLAMVGLCGLRRRS